MSSRQARREHRAAMRKAKKAELKRLAVEQTFVEQTIVEQTLVDQTPVDQTPVGRTVLPSAIPNRAEINRANAQHSTGPRTEAGKLASSRNSLKHGLASGELIILGEEPAAYEALLADLLDEHQPANPTEDLLVQQMAQSWWLVQRAIRFQNDCFLGVIDEKRLAVFLRYQSTHDRAFHKALSTLLRLQKERRKNPAGFVSQNDPTQGPEQSDGPAEIGFVSQNPENFLPPLPNSPLEDAA